MSDQLIQEVEADQIKTDPPDLAVGDTVDVHVRIIEGSKQRIQVFNGVIIKMQGSGLSRTFTVRRIVANEGVERTFPIHSPKLDKVEVKRHGHIRRSKLYYLRERLGKKRRLRDRRRSLGSLAIEKPEPEQPEAAEADLVADAESAQPAVTESTETPDES